MNEMYMLVALRRAKDKENEGLSARCHRHLVDTTKEEALDQLKERCHEPGLWRIYRAVNKRDLTKAMKALQTWRIIKGKRRIL